MSPPVDLIKAIRTGLLSEVIAALDAGAPIELHDGQGDPGLPLAMACFTGHAEICLLYTSEAETVFIFGG